jgi:hypothetical protein
MPYTAALLANDPLEFCDHSLTRLHTVPREQLQALQLEALQMRFVELRDAIPMLTRLADKQQIMALETLDDVVPLLFEHTMYKSYPPSMLENNRFDQLTKWLGKLTSLDLSNVDVSGCEGVGDWLGALDAQTPLCVPHSSSTSGTMSFLPMSKREFRKFARVYPIEAFGKFGSDEIFPDEPVGADIIFPSYRSGYSAHFRINDFTMETVAGSEAKFHAAFPGSFDSDILVLAGRIRSAQQKGQLDRLKISPALLARKEKVDAFQKQMPALMADFLDRKIDELKGRQVFLSGTWNILYNLAEAGLAKGLRKVFAPTSVVLTGGGAKGMTPPDNWVEVIAEFMGVERVRMAYGMTETHAQHGMCEHGRYHIAPWVILCMLDPDTSEPLPRTGIVTGRAAFFDLSAETHWGGFISGDEVTVDWDGACSCGRTTPHLAPTIERYSEKRGGDDKISCAATEGAHREAMDFLTEYAAPPV